MTGFHFWVNLSLKISFSQICFGAIHYILFVDQNVHKAVCAGLLFVTLRDFLDPFVITVRSSGKPEELVGSYFPLEKVSRFLPYPDFSLS